MSTDNENDIPLEKSKSQKKRDAEALQELGTALTKLNEEQLKSIPLPQNLLEAISAARNIHQHGGLKRQLQYIGKLMRDIDPQPVKQALSKLQRHQHHEAAKLHQLESWRDQLILDSSTVMSELLSSFPQLDRQYLRQLVRNAQHETQQQKPPKSARKLFKYLQQLANTTET